MGNDVAAVVTFLNARLKDDRARVEAAGGEGRIAWLTYHDDAGQLLYTTVASGPDTAEAPDDEWFADGKELPTPASVLVVYDSARQLAEIEAKRRILNRHQPVTLPRLVSGRMQDVVACDYDTDPDGAGWVAYPCPDILDLAAPHADHPDLPDDLIRLRFHPPSR